MPRIELERIEEEDDLTETSLEEFDRLAFAQRAIALVSPREATVAVCGGSRRLRLLTGRQWGDAPAARWAILTVPADASRRAIATAVLELGSVGRAWSLDVLLHQAAR